MTGRTQWSARAEVFGWPACEVDERWARPCWRQPWPSVSRAAPTATPAPPTPRSKAADVLASATAEAQDKIDEFKNGVDAKGDVSSAT